MASTRGLSIAEPIIPLTSKLTEEDFQYVTLTRMVPVGNDMEKRREELPMVASVDEVEYLLRVVVEFRDACSAERLSLTSGPNLFTYFRRVLGGIVRDEFDTIRANHPQTVNGFGHAVNDLIGQYIRPTDLADQRHYLETTKKPFKLPCLQLGGRLKMINKLMSRFPGANGVNPFNEDDLKQIFYQLMLDDWKLTFLQNGRDISDPNYGFDEMVRYFELLEKAQALKRKRQDAVTNRNNKKHKKGNQGRNGNRGGNNPQGATITNGDSSKNCPFHPGMHSWNDCFGNPSGRNYRPNFRLQAPGTRRQQRNASGVGTGQAGGHNRGNNRGGGSNRQNQGRDAYASETTNTETCDSNDQNDQTVQGDSHWMEDLGANW